MQVHNHDAKQTLFALNHWREGDKADIGIGNATMRQSGLDFRRQRRALPDEAAAGFGALPGRVQTVTPLAFP